MLHHHPELVRMDLLPDDGPAHFPPYDTYPPRPEWVPPSGVLSSARGADAAKGAAMAQELTERLVAAIRPEFGMDAADLE